MRTLILIAIAFITFQGVAQDKIEKEQKEQKEHREHGEHGEPRKEHKQMLKDMSPEEMATITTKKMTLALDLSEKQQAQVKELMLEQAKVMKENGPGKRAQMTKGEEKKDLSKDERVKMINQRLDQQISMKQKMKTILTKEQYEKFEKMQGRRDQNRKVNQKTKPKY